MGSKRCPICGRFFEPDIRNRRRQQYDSRRCAKKAKQRYDQLYQRELDATAEGKFGKREKARQYRQRVDWARLMRYRRKADPRSTARLNRKAARRYYQRHREQILQKRRQQRAGRKAAQTPRSQ